MSPTMVTLAWGLGTLLVVQGALFVFLVWRRASHLRRIDREQELARSAGQRPAEQAGTGYRTTRAVAALIRPQPMKQRSAGSRAGQVREPKR